MPHALLDRPVPAAGPARRRSPLAALAALALVAVLGAVLLPRIDLPGRPFGTEQVDRSTPALMTALEDLDDFHAATGSFQVVVDLEDDVRWVPSAIAGERTTFLATGTVDGVVSLADVAEGAEVSADGRSVVFSLPPAQLSDARVDLANSRVIARDRGLVDRVGGMFSDNPTSEREVSRLAERKLTAAADESDLRDRAEDGTRELLTALATSLGYERVEVRFDAADPR